MHCHATRLQMTINNLEVLRTAPVFSESSNRLLVASASRIVVSDSCPQEAQL
jgi:hypothetical protein